MTLTEGVGGEWIEPPMALRYFSKDDPGDLCEVEFKDGTMTTIPLCDDCRQQVSNGDLVQAVKKLEA